MFESKVEIIKKIVFPKDDRNQVIIEVESGWHWQGAKLKDFWKTWDWSEKLKVGSQIRMWTIQFSRIIGFEAYIDGKWIAAWCCGNDFSTAKVAKQREDSYINFIKSEGKKIAKLIDKGMNLKQIDKNISNEHSGNTYGCALNIGISTAKNKANAEYIRKTHNLKYGVKESSGTVNPAILTIRASK